MDHTRADLPATIPTTRNCSHVDASAAADGPPHQPDAQSGLISRRCAFGGLPAAPLSLGTPGPDADEGGPLWGASPHRFGGAVGGVGGPPTTLIHEDKTGNPWGKWTYEPISDRLTRYGDHHRRALEMARFCEAEQPHRSEKLRECGAFLQFRDYYTVEQVRLTAGHFCQQDRLCGLCACRRGGRYLRSYVEKTRAVMCQEEHLRPFLVTLTVRDGADLEERVLHLLRSHRRMMDLRRDTLKDRRRGHAGALSAACCAAGGVGSCEVKRGSGSGLWHPHWHAIWLCGSAPDVQLLREEWRRITGDSHVVDARPFHFTQELAEDAGDGSTWERMAGDFCEVFKYALKLGDLSLADNWSAFLQLQRKRLIEPFGVLRGVEIPEDLRDEPLAPDLPFIEILTRYHHAAGAYVGTGQTHHSHDLTRCSPWPRFSV